jgi:hypothetical protein
METGYPLSGKISTRKCPTCGHHEVGYVTADGAFYPLKPGDTINILPGKARTDLLESNERPEPGVPIQELAASAGMVAWIPDPVRHDKQLRMKYGIFIRNQMVQSGVTESIYELAYRQKLQNLIEKEVYVPLPVILDRYFNSPHLAAGNSKDIADALFDELDEVREPVHRMGAWIEKKDDESLKNLIHPKLPEDLAQGLFSEDDFKRELDSLSLEEFFDLL